MKSGSACKIDDTVDRGNKEIDVTINTAPIISAIQRIMKNLFFIKIIKDFNLMER